jgi:amidase
MAGQEAVASVNGPLARTLADVTLYSQLMIDAEPWLMDPKCLPIPWRDVDVPKKLKIGVLWNDGIVTPTPPVQRALAFTVDKLRKAGHELVSWDNKGHLEAVMLLVRNFLSANEITLTFQ